jgi:hypothetical protein
MLFYTGTIRLTHRILYRIQRATIFEKVAKNIETRAEQNICQTGQLTQNHKFQFQLLGNMQLRSISRKLAAAPLYISESPSVNLQLQYRNITRSWSRECSRRAEDTRGWRAPPCSSPALKSELYQFINTGVDIRYCCL